MEVGVVRINVSRPGEALHCRLEVSLHPVNYSQVAEEFPVLPILPAESFQDFLGFIEVAAVSEGEGELAEWPEVERVEGGDALVGLVHLSEERVHLCWLLLFPEHLKELTDQIEVVFVAVAVDDGNLGLLLLLEETNAVEDLLLVRAGLSGFLEEDSRLLEPSGGEGPLPLLEEVLSREHPRPQLSRLLKEDLQQLGSQQFSKVAFFVSISTPLNANDG